MFGNFKDRFSLPLPSWIHDVWDNSVLSQLPDLNVAVLRLAAAKLGKNKACASDNILGEFISELDDHNMGLFVNLFRDKLLNSFGPELCWHFHFVRLIEKTAGTILLNKFRPIAILTTIYKWFSIILSLLAGESLTNIVEPQFAFRGGYQVSEVTFILNQVVEKLLNFNSPFSSPTGTSPKPKISLNLLRFFEVVKMLVFNVS